MSKILINDGNLPVIDELLHLMKNTADIVTKPFDKKTDITEYDMVLLQIEGTKKAVLEKLKHLRYAARFRNIPILLLQPPENEDKLGAFFPFSAKSILSLGNPPFALAQMLQSYLMPGRQPKPWEMQYLNPFIESTKKVFTTMGSMEVSYNGVYFKNDYNLLGDVSGIIGLSGNAEGMVVITFYWDLAQEIISRIMGVDQTAISAELINDGVGELINMISGAAKRYLADTPYYFQLSLPTVFVGWQHEVGHPEKASVAVLMFDFENKSFAVQVSLTANGINHKKA